MCVMVGSEGLDLLRVTQTLCQLDNRQAQAKIKNYHQSVVG